MFKARGFSCFAFIASLSEINPLSAGGYISSAVTGLMPTVSEETVQAKEEPPVQKPTCRQLPKSGRFTASHTQGNGIGYRYGYTSLEFFGASPYLIADWLVPFIDLRAHLLNDGMPAGNAGAGLRYVKSRVWGINAYYDYRKSHHRQYRQASAGLESLGKVWDFRINGYLPFKAKRTGFYNTQFDHTEGTTLFFSKKYEFDFKGANAEIGVHFKRESYLPLYFALGPYYLTGQGDTSWGGSLRLNCELSSCFTLEGSTSYDSLFGWTGQGYLSLNVSFGFKKQKECERRRFPFARAVQKVCRHEIIPLKTGKVLFAGH